MTPQSATNCLWFFTYFVFSRAQSLSYFIDDSCDKTRIGNVMAKAIYMHRRAATRLWDPYDYNQTEMFQWLFKASAEDDDKIVGTVK